MSDFSYKNCNRHKLYERDREREQLVPFQSAEKKGLWWLVQQWITCSVSIYLCHPGECRTLGALSKWLLNMLPEIIVQRRGRSKVYRRGLVLILLLWSWPCSQSKTLLDRLRVCLDQGTSAPLKCAPPICSHLQVPDTKILQWAWLLLCWPHSEALQRGLKGGHREMLSSIITSVSPGLESVCCSKRVGCAQEWPSWSSLLLWYRHILTGSTLEYERVCYMVRSGQICQERFQQAALYIQRQGNGFPQTKETK